MDKNGFRAGESSRQEAPLPRPFAYLDAIKEKILLNLYISRNKI